MKLFGVTITRQKAAEALSVPARGFWTTIFDWRPGAWQSDDAGTPDPIEQLTAFSAVFACATKIAADIAKLRVKLARQDDDGIWAEVRAGSPFLPVLRKPNHFQTRIQFFVSWLLSLLLRGNTYILKGRDARNVVTSLYVLDACRVTPLVAPDGQVFYRIGLDYLSGVYEEVTLPASEIIHDRINTLWHPLVGVSPIYACAMSAMQGRRIQKNSSKFFENMSRPSGMLTAPGSIDDVTATRLKEQFESGFKGVNLGRLFVGGDGLKYEPMTIPADDAQLIEQLKWTVEDVARCFHMPLWKIGAAAMPAQGNSEISQRAYYEETLQNPMESIEVLLDEGLSLPNDMGAEFDLTALLRMDTAARYDANTKAVSGGWMSPNEARRNEDLPPVSGGESPLIQQQNYSLAALAKRDAQDDPFASSTATPEPAPPQIAPHEDAAKALMAAVIRRSVEAPLNV